MQIKVDDAIIHEAVKGEVKHQVTQWIANNPKVIEQEVRKEIYDQVNRKYFDIIKDKAEEIASEEVVERVCNRISTDVARAYAERYYEYN